MPENDAEPQLPMVVLPPSVTTMQHAQEQLPGWRPDFDCCSELRKNFETNEKVRLVHVKQEQEANSHQCGAEPNSPQSSANLTFVDCPSYSINRQGHIVNHNTNKLVPDSHREKKSHEERRVKLKDVHGKEKKLRVHRLVAQAFLPPPLDPSWTQVYHRDGRRCNCHVDNLFWGPQSKDCHVLRAAESAAASSPNQITTLYDRGHTKQGLLNPFTWSLEIRESRGGSEYAPEWFPYYTAFNQPDLVQDLNVERSPKVLLHHEHWAQDIQECGGHEFNSDQVKRAQIEVGPASDNLWWALLHIYTTTRGQEYTVHVSISGLIRDPTLRTIGSGQISVRHARHKVYRPDTRDCNGNRPVWPVENMVLAAWLGFHYHQHFLDSSDPASLDPETISKLTIHHVDGNVHHNHLYNLVVIPEAQLTSDPHFDQVLLSILERIEPVWCVLEAQAPVSSPGMSPQYARNLLNRRATTTIATNSNLADEGCSLLTTPPVEHH